MCKPGSPKGLRASHFVGMLLLLSSGCGSLAVPRIEQPNVDSQSAAAEAIRLYDKEADGRLNSDELSACPAISLDRYDQDSDGFVSEDEVAARLLTIFSTNAGLLEVRCRITLGGRPLAGATLRLIPEPFLANALHAAEGTTDAKGTAVMSIPSEQLPPHLQNDQLPKHLQDMRAMQPGIYHVEIEHPNIKQPQKPLGCEVDPTSRGGTDFEFRL